MMRRKFGKARAGVVGCGPLPSDHAPAQDCALAAQPLHPQLPVQRWLVCCAPSRFWLLKFLVFPRSMAFFLTFAMPTSSQQPCTLAHLHSFARFPFFH
eukprot:2677872-Pleurochrysis_carterae.AAC.1